MMKALRWFLLARIAEDESVALHGDGGLMDGDAHFSSTRMLAECEAKRRIVGMLDGIPPPDMYAPEQAAVREVLLHLALPYASHPDYVESWRLP